MHDPKDDTLRVFEIQMAPEHKEIAIGVLFHQGFNSFEEFDGNHGSEGLRIWTAPHLTTELIRGWFSFLYFHYSRRSYCCNSEIPIFNSRHHPIFNIN